MNPRLDALAIEPGLRCIGRRVPSPRHRALSPFSYTVMDDRGTVVGTANSAVAAWWDARWRRCGSSHASNTKGWRAYE